MKSKYQLNDNNIAYIGDDLIDIPVMDVVALPIAVANANSEVKKISLHVTETVGGEGAFREAISWIISEQGRTDEVIQSMKERILNS